MAQRALSTKYKNRLIQKFVKAIKQAAGNLGTYKFWPAEAAQIEAYFNCFLSTWFFEKYKENPKKFREGLKRLRINHIYFLLYEFIVLGLKVAKTFENYPINQKEIIDFVVFIADAAQEKTQDEIFCPKGTHKILTKIEIKNIFKRKRWIEADPQKRKEIGKLAAAANSLDWSLYFDIYALTGMVSHGPYQYKDGIMIIRDWFDLNPPIWKVRNKYPNLAMCLIYEPIKDLRFDIMNHFTTKENMTGKLIKFSAESKGKALNISQIKKLTTYYNRLTARQTQYVNNLKPMDIITRGAEIGYYMYNDFFKHYKTDWHPPKEVYNFIKRQGLKYWNRYYRFKSISKPTKSPDYIVNKLDPRKEAID